MSFRFKHLIGFLGGAELVIEGSHDFLGVLDLLKLLLQPFVACLAQSLDLLRKVTIRLCDYYRARVAEPRLSLERLDFLVAALKCAFLRGVLGFKLLDAYSVLAYLLCSQRLSLDQLLSELLDKPVSAQPPGDLADDLRGGIEGGTASIIPDRPRRSSGLRRGDSWTTSL